jgi:hypothetical protein
MSAIKPVSVVDPEASMTMKPQVLKRIMRRRKGRRPAQVVDHIQADDSPGFEALSQAYYQLGFRRPGSASRAVKLDVPEYSPPWSMIWQAGRP